MNTAPAWRETAVCFDCEGETLVGVVTAPRDPAGATDLGVVIVVGGPQYRAGSHRMFVRLARALAGAGCSVLRFDVRGMGDSTGEPPGFEQQSADIAAAIAALRAAQPAVRRVVLWGLCDGASAALLYLHAEPEAAVDGVCLVNPWVRTDTLQARTQIRHYYLQRVLQPAFWKKLIRGGVGPRALGEMRASLQRAGTARDDAPSYVECMRRGLDSHAGAVLLIQSGNDFTAREFDELLRSDARWRAAMTRPGISRRDVVGADHTFSNDGAMERLETCVIEWIARDLLRDGARTGTTSTEAA